MSDWLSATPGMRTSVLRMGAKPIVPTSAAGASPPSKAVLTKVANKFGYTGVPLVAQDKPNTCWYAAACMVSYFYRAGPRLGVPEIWEHGDTMGITPAEFVQLARNEGLTTDGITTYHAGTDIIYPPPILIDLLRISRGPIWCAGYWFGPGHIIVLVGVEGDKVWFNDPDGGVRKSGTVAWFNEKVARDVVGHMMHKDLARS